MKIYYHFKWAFWAFLPLVTGCTPPQRLSVRTEYITPQSLASYVVGTPDPCQENPSIGQRLIISWRLPKDYQCYEDLHLNLKVRFHNREEIERDIPISYRNGYHLFSILDEKFCETKGILTYRVDLIGNGCILDKWRHQLWVDLIKFDIPKS